MHLCLEGTFKALLTLWFDSSNKDRVYYLGSSQNLIDNLLLETKYPAEYSRTQKSIKNWSLYKANEYKNLVLNSAVYVFKNFLPEEYYKHFFLYVIFLRILTDENIDNSQIIYASKLINHFVHDFEGLYGEDNLTYNLHAHLHIPLQVWLFRPLNKLSCFPYEVTHFSLEQKPLVSK